MTFVILTFFKKNFFTLFLLTLSLIQFLFYFLYNFESDFISKYLFLSPDSYSWAVDSLYWSGYDVDFVARQPGLPIIYSVFEYLNLPSYIILLNYFFAFLHIVSLIMIFSILLKDKFLALVSSLFFVSSSFIHFYSSNFLADIYSASASAIGVLFMILFIRNNFSNLKYLFLSFLFFLISFHFQYIGLIGVIINIIFIVFIVLFKLNNNVKNLLFSFDFKLLFHKKTLLNLFCIFILILFGLWWFIYRLIYFGDFFYSGVIQFDLFRFNFNNLDYYFVNLINVFTFLGLFFILFGFYRFINILFHFKNNISILYFVFYYLMVFMFWIFFYDWPDARFILYFYPLFLFILIIGISNIVVFVKNITLKRFFIFIFVLFLSFGSSLSNNIYIYKHNSINLFPFLGGRLEFDYFINKNGSIDLIISKYKLIFDTIDICNSSLTYFFSESCKYDSLQFFQDKKNRLDIFQYITKKGINVNEVCIDQGVFDFYSTRNHFAYFFKTKSKFCDYNNLNNYKYKYSLDSNLNDVFNIEYSNNYFVLRKFFI